MNGVIDVEIVPRGDADAKLLTGFGSLSAELVSKGLACAQSRVNLPGVKADLVLAISIAGLAVSSISTLVSVLTFWLSLQPKYSVTMKRGDATYELSNLDRDQVLEVSRGLANAGAKTLVVGVGRK